MCVFTFNCINPDLYISVCHKQIIRLAINCIQIYQHTGVFHKHYMHAYQDVSFCHKLYTNLPECKCDCSCTEIASGREPFRVERQYRIHCRWNLKRNHNKWKQMEKPLSLKPKIKSKQIQTKVSNNGPWILHWNHNKHIQKFKTMANEP